MPRLDNFLRRLIRRRNEFNVMPAKAGIHVTFPRRRGRDWRSSPSASVTWLPAFAGMAAK
jgi:hypothetical protein